MPCSARRVVKRFQGTTPKTRAEFCDADWFAGCGMLVAGGFCYRMLVDESRIARESQNSPAPARASDRLLSIWSFQESVRGWPCPESRRC